MFWFHPYSAHGVPRFALPRLWSEEGGSPHCPALFFFVTAELSVHLFILTWVLICAGLLWCVTGRLKWLHTCLCHYQVKDIYMRNTWKGVHGYAPTSQVSTMSHSALAMQWEANGDIRDKARRLLLATCQNMDMMHATQYVYQLAFHFSSWGGGPYGPNRPGCSQEQHPHADYGCELFGASGWCGNMHGACTCIVWLHANPMPPTLWQDFIVCSHACWYPQVWSHPHVLTNCPSEDLLQRHRGGNSSAYWPSRRIGWLIDRTNQGTRCWGPTCRTLGLIGLMPNPHLPVPMQRPWKMSRLRTLKRSRKARLMRTLRMMQNVYRMEVQVCMGGTIMWTYHLDILSSISFLKNVCTSHVRTVWDVEYSLQENEFYVCTHANCFQVHLQCLWAMRCIQARIRNRLKLRSLWCLPRRNLRFWLPLHPSILWSLWCHQRLCQAQFLVLSCVEKSWICWIIICMSL